MGDVLSEQDKYKVFYNTTGRYRTAVSLRRMTAANTDKRHRREDVSRSCTYHKTTNRTVYAREQ